MNLESWHKSLGRKVGTFPKLKINLHPTSTYHVRLRFMNIIFFRLFGIDWFGPGSLEISLANLTADDFLETHPWYFQGEKRQQNTFLSPQTQKSLFDANLFMMNLADLSSKNGSLMGDNIRFILGLPFRSVVSPAVVKIMVRG